MDKIKIIADTKKFDDEIEAEIEKVENFKILRNSIGAVAGLGSLSFFAYSMTEAMDENSDFTDNQRKTLRFLSLIGAIGAGIVISASNAAIADIFEERAERKSDTNIKRIKIQKNQYLTDCINKRLAEIKKEEENREQIEEINSKKKKR
jgi:hypothetical protein